MVEKIVLPNGVRILFERLDHVRSASVGFWVGSGSRHEPEEQNGISHFIEHMVFKGTKRRTAAQIAEEMDAIGGQMNAFTTKECTCFYARALDTHLHIALDVLCDIFFEPKMDDGDLVTERGVIFEEIDMYEDTPDDLVVERLFSNVYRGTPLGMPVIGVKPALEKMTGDTLASYMRGNYLPQHTIVSISGSFSDSDIQFLKDRFSAMPGGTRAQSANVDYAPAFITCAKPIEQNHLCLGFPSTSAASEKRHVLQTMSSILGGGMSSRLFQRVREERGLCYSIYTFSAAHEDTGVLGVYLALSDKTEEDALGLTHKIVREFRENGPTASELDRAREQLKANVLMSMESMNTRMNHMARSEMVLGRIPTLDEIIERYNSVTLDSIMELASEILDFDRLSFSAVGKIGDEDKYKRIIY